MLRVTQLSTNPVFGLFSLLEDQPDYQNWVRAVFTLLEGHTFPKLAQYFTAEQPAFTVRARDGVDIRAECMISKRIVEGANDILDGYFKATQEVERYRRDLEQLNLELPKSKPTQFTPEQNLVDIVVSHSGRSQHKIHIEAKIYHSSKSISKLLTQILKRRVVRPQGGTNFHGALFYVQANQDLEPSDVIREVDTIDGWISLTREDTSSHLIQSDFPACQIRCELEMARALNVRAVAVRVHIISA